MLVAKPCLVLSVLYATAQYIDGEGMIHLEIQMESSSRATTLAAYVNALCPSLLAAAAGNTVAALVL